MDNMDNRIILVMSGLILVLIMLPYTMAQEGKVEIVDSKFNCSDATLTLSFLNLNPTTIQIDRVEIESCNITDTVLNSVKHGEIFSVNGKCDLSSKDKEFLNVSVIYIEKTGEITGIVYKNTYVLGTKCRQQNTKEVKNIETPKDNEGTANIWPIIMAVILICLVILLIAIYLKRTERKKRV